MKLSVFERLLLLNILPKEGDFLTLKVLRKLKDDVGFDEEELAALQFKQEGTAVRWLTEADRDKDIEIGPKAHSIIADTLTALDKQKKLAEQHISLYEKFVEGAGE